MKVAKNSEPLVNCHVQVGGEIKNPKGIYGGFAAFANNLEIKNSSALIFNGFVPFIFYQANGGLDHIAHYITSPVINDLGGLIGYGGFDGAELPYIKNSTLISDYLDYEELKDPVVYVSSSVDQEKSTNNFIVLVGRENEDEFSRHAYKLKEVEENGIKVWKKGTEEGKISIAKRAFQDEYWGKKAEEHETGEAESKFAYVIKNPGTLQFRYFGFGANKIAADFLTASLKDYFTRHGGIYVENGPIYDLLGIRAFPSAPKK